MYIFNLAGAKFRPTASQAEVITLTPGTELMLRRDPNNAYDSNAIEVVSCRTGAMLGFVPRYIAAELAPQMDIEREEFGCFVKYSCGDKAPTLEVGLQSSESYLKAKCWASDPPDDDEIPF